MIPFLDINKFLNPGKLFEQYLTYLPSQDPEAPLFPKPRLSSKHFDLLDPETLVLFEENRKVGRNNVRTMLPELCAMAGVERCTNHQGMNAYFHHHTS